MPRFQIKRFRAATAAALLSLPFALPAFAGHDDWDDDDDGRRRGYPVHRHERSCDSDDWDRGGYRGRDGDRGHYGGRSYSEGRGYRQRGDYGCRPCGRRWNDRHAFHNHLSHHHRVPFWAFPRVIVQAGWGWAYRG